jgi:conjugative transfer signal peptidase TraF
MDRKLLVLLGAIVMALALSPWIKSPFYFNLTPSEPLGVYYRASFSGRLRQGEMVFLEVPLQARPYLYGRAWLKKGVLLLKHVGATDGDQVSVTDHEIRINGSYIGPVASVDFKGRPLPKLRGKFRVRRQYFLPIATYRWNSFDGRYYGPVPYSLVRGKAVPLITF